jgi:glycosyltransferase involved in cell wall biosynthesis
LGFLLQPQLAEAYRSADILLSASWYESFPLFPLEAMACGLPVITTQQGTEEFATPGVSAEVVRPRDPPSIADGLVRLITDASYRSAIAVEGNRASKAFTWNASAKRMESLLFEVEGCP